MLRIIKIDRSNAFGESFFANADPTGMPAINGNKASKDKITISGVNI